MGISIHYSGTIGQKIISDFCDELADISLSLGFDDPVRVDDDEKGLRGIILRPKSAMECIPFLCDSAGRLHSLGDLIAGWDEKTAILSVAVKTQYADCADHIWLVGLLRYVKRKYMPELKVLDEGGYWESEDPVELKRRMEFLGSIIKSFGAKLESAFMDTAVDRDNPDALADFIERVAEEFSKENRGGA